MLAIAAFEHGDLVEAEARLKAGTAAAPRDPALRLNLGIIELLLGKADASAKQLRRVLAQYPDNQDAKLQLAVALFTKGDLDGSEALYKELAADGQNPLATFDWALLKEEQQQHREALALLKTYLGQSGAKLDAEAAAQLRDGIQGLVSASLAGPVVP
jgi:tetratricopeptide (TPR) repeat protein